MTKFNTNNIQPNSAELALFWASKGYRVFPVRIDKKPNLGFKWKEHATIDSDMIRAYWDSAHKGAGVGIVTGAYCNTLVLDVDNKNGVNGSTSLKILEEEYGSLPNTLKVQTPSGGFHYFLTYDDCGLTIDANIRDGIDYRGQNGFVLAAGSIIKDGQYTVINDAPIATLPKWLVGILKRENTSQDKNATPSKFMASGSRNTSLTSIAGSMRRKGMEQEEIEEYLLAMNSALPEPLGEQEVCNIAKSVAKYDPSDTTIYTNEQDFSESVAKKWDGEVRYVSGIGYMLNDKDIWVRDVESLKTKRMLQDTVNQACLELEKIASTQKTTEQSQKILMLRGKLKKRAFQNNCLELIKSHPLLLTYTDDLDRFKNIVGLTSGLFNLDTKEHVLNASTYLVTKRLNVSYDPKAECPLFDKMMVRLFPDDETRNYVLKSLGYALSGSNNEKCFFIWVGSGDNGKSTIIEAISAILSDYSVTLDPDSFIRKMGSSISNDIARLRGTRLCVTSETAAGAVLDVALVKRLSGNDTMSCRFLHEEYFEFTNKAVVFMLSNFIPVFDGADGGIVNRVRIVPFEQVITKDEKDPLLSDKLKAEHSGIFNRLLEAHDLYKSEGLEMPDSIREATHKFCNQSNLIGQFVNEHIELTDSEHAGVTSVYQQYRGWAESQGYKPLSANIFNTNFEAYTKAEKKRASIGNVWQGVKLNYCFGSTL